MRPQLTDVVASMAAPAVRSSFFSSCSPAHAAQISSVWPCELLASLMLGLGYFSFPPGFISLNISLSEPGTSDLHVRELFTFLWSRG